MNPSERLREVLTEAQTIQSEGVLDATKSAKLAELLTEGRELKAQIEQSKSLAELNDWAGQSAGTLPIAGAKATVESMTPAGATVVERTPTGVQLLEQYGEGIGFDPATKSLISSKEYQDGFKSYIRKGASGLKASELKTLQEGADSQGGFLVPSDILDRVISKEPTPTRVAGRVTQLQTSRDTLVIPKVNYSADDLYTTGMRVTWTGEVPASSTAMRVTEPVFGQSHIPVFTAMMSIPVTNDMVEDATFPLVSYVSGKFAETIELLRDNMILNGTGQGQPAGILANPDASDGSQPSSIHSTSASALTGAGIVNLGFALPEQYDDNACFVMNKTNTAAAVANLVDGNGRFLWGSGLQDSGLAVNLHERQLLGYPVIFSGFMPNVASNAFPIAFGDFTGYYLVNRVGFSIQVLRELYAETNQILLLGRIRFGGQVAEPWKIKLQKVAS